MPSTPAGLLSESAPFAQAVRAAGLVFVGPRAETIALMGDKVTARQAASGLPVLPGSEDPVPDVEAALAIADRIGWPLAVKANFGGGGRGLRIAEDRAALVDALAQASREAAAFGRGEVFLERYLVRPNPRLLGAAPPPEAARRGSRPPPGLAPDLRARIEAAAVKLCRDVGYEGAGTVEFLDDPAVGDFFLLEMNTRLQVEHRVTELIAGIDIVREQICIAGGAPLSFAQEDDMLRGHAIQARLTAEDPRDDFRAAPGRIEALDLPAGPWLRADFGVQAGAEVPVHYDSLSASSTPGAVPR